MIKVLLYSLIHNYFAFILFIAFFLHSILPKLINNFFPFLFFPFFFFFVFFFLFFFLFFFFVFLSLYFPSTIDNVAIASRECCERFLRVFPFERLV